MTPGDDPIFELEPRPVGRGRRPWPGVVAVLTAGLSIVFAAVLVVQSLPGGGKDQNVAVVDVGAPAFAASCVRACENGMQVKTDTPEVERSRAMLTKLLISDQPARERDPKQTTTGDNELLALAGTYQVSGEGGLPCGSGRGARGIEFG